MTIVSGPIAAPQQYMTLSGIPLSVSAPGLLNGVSDPNGLTPYLSSLGEPPANGTLCRYSDGSFVYTPNPGFTGPSDKFTYVPADTKATGSPAKARVGVATLTLKEVRFDPGNDHYNLKGDPGEQPIIGNRWTERTQDTLWYKRGATITVDATFALSQPWSGGQIQIYAYGPDGQLWIPRVDATVNAPDPWYPNGSVEISNKSSLVPLANYVADFPLTLTWYATLAGATVGTQVGVSANETYLSLKTPVETSEFNTVVYLGCHNAQGDTVESDTALDIWNRAFSQNSVATKEGTALFYYKEFDTIGTTTEYLLKEHDGRCGAWASFTVDVLCARYLRRFSSWRCSG